MLQHNRAAPAVACPDRLADGTIREFGKQVAPGHHPSAVHWQVDLVFGL